jgi:hypothetical protein
MDAEGIEFIKHRDIVFTEFHPDPNQASTAALLLADVEGILRVTPATPRHLQVSYHLLEVSLEQIEYGLQEMGLHLDNRLFYRLRRALHYYTEENQRANHGCSQSDAKCTRKIFADRYQRLTHGCRDPRPEHWRKYL